MLRLEYQSLLPENGTVGADVSDAMHLQCRLSQNEIFFISQEIFWAAYMKKCSKEAFARQKNRGRAFSARAKAHGGSFGTISLLFIFQGVMLCDLCAGLLCLGKEMLCAGRACDSPIARRHSVMSVF